MWKVLYYAAKSGRYPVKEFIDSLDGDSQSRIFHTLDLLKEFGVHLGMPYAKYLEKQLWELRVRHARNRYRIIHFLAAGETFILLHGLTKKTGPVPRSDIETADKRRSDYLTQKG